jgi:hypothetical protein
VILAVRYELCLSALDVAPGLVVEDVLVAFAVDRETAAASGLPDEVPAVDPEHADARHAGHGGIDRDERSGRAKNGHGRELIGTVHDNSGVLELLHVGIRGEGRSGRNDRHGPAVDDRRHLTAVLVHDDRFAVFAFPGEGGRDEAARAVRSGVTELVLLAAREGSQVEDAVGQGLSRVHEGHFHGHVRRESGGREQEGEGEQDEGTHRNLTGDCFFLFSDLLDARQRRASSRSPV